MDLDRLAASLAAAFPDAPEIAPLEILGEGFGNLVVETGGGVVYRIAKHAGAQRALRRESRVLPVVARRVGAVRVPLARRRLEGSAAFPYGVVGYDKLPGRPLSPAAVDDGNRDALAGQAAAFLRALHAIDLAELRDAGLPRFPPPPDRLLDLWRNVAAYLERRLDPNELRAARRWLDGALDYERRHPYAPALVHGDFWHENLLVGGEPLRLAGVVDFENVAVGDPAVDLATLRYLGDPFARAAAAAYFRGNVPRDLDERIGALMGIREVLGLEHGLRVGDVDADALGKVREAVLSAAKHVRRRRRRSP